MISALRQKRPVIATINVTETFGTVGDDGKIVIDDDFQIQGGHALCVVGYDGDQDQIKFSNMWESDCGDAEQTISRRSSRALRF